MSNDQAGNDPTATRKLNDNYATVNLSPAEAQEALKKAQAQAQNNYATVNLSPAEAQAALKQAQTYADPTPSMYLGTPSAPLKTADDVQPQWQPQSYQQPQQPQSYQQPQRPQQPQQTFESGYHQQMPQQQAPHTQMPAAPGRQMPWAILAIGTAILLLVVVGILIML